MRILLVEDEPLLAMAVGMALTAAGHTVVGPVSTVRDGLKLAEQIVPDLALVDIDLRGGGSGIDLAREMLRRFGTPVLFASGEVVDARANRDAAIGFIAKPCSSRAVLASVEAAKAISDGAPLPPHGIPPELELFRRAA